MKVDLDAIKARLQAATPGPWKDTGWSSIKAATGDWVCQFFDKLEISQRRTKANLHFVAHAPEDITTLLAEVERLRAQVNDLRDALVKGHGVMDNAEMGIIALEAENERLNIAKGMVTQLQAEVERLQEEFDRERAARLDAEKARDLLQQGNSVLLAELAAAR